MRAKHLVLILACTAFAGSAAHSQEEDFACMLTGSCLSPAELKKAIAAAQAFPLGSEKNPVRVHMPAGERAYLERLRCSDGNAPAFERGGSVGLGPYSAIMDVYELKCLSGEPKTASVYMDMYHDHVEAEAVPGFTIKPAR